MNKTKEKSIQKTESKDSKKLDTKKTSSFKKRKK